MATSPVFLPGKFHGQRSWAGCSPRGRRELTEHSTACIYGLHCVSIEQHRSRSNEVLSVSLSLSIIRLCSLLIYLEFILSDYQLSFPVCPWEND